jgi:hypothetical protein
VGLYSQPFSGLLAASYEVSRSHTTTRDSRYDSSGRVISSSQRPLPDNTQHSQQTNVHAPSGIRTHNLSRRTAVDLRLRSRGCWDRHCNDYNIKIIKLIKLIRIKLQYCGIKFVATRSMLTNSCLDLTSSEEISRK